MSITAADVNNLRKATGAGMMDCKNALVEANGDFDAAVDILRKKGQKVAAKRGDRDATEGLVVAKTNADGSNGAIIVLNCETDFVAKNDDFVNFANKIAEIAVNASPSSLEELKAQEIDGMPISEKIIEQTGVIGEKIDLSRYHKVSAGTVYAYNHPGNKVASVVGLNKGGNVDAAKDVAMQIAAMDPIALDKDDVSQEVIDKEIEVGKDLAIQEGKPAEMAEKIAIGRLNKFFKENTLLNQQYIKDNKQTIRDFLSQQEQDLTVTEFKRFALS
ncbi:MAG: elongation factor Ts [Flavobacteriales bacterium]|nr:elongation factor Ts [Flavobacteriales bacterium]